MRNIHWLPSSSGGILIHHRDRVNDYTFGAISGNQYRKPHPTPVAGDDREAICRWVLIDGEMVLVTESWIPLGVTQPP